jgi:tRNA-2-methylthio-N6-dimethylallyladenosine synthase
VAGCVAQAEGKEILARAPFVDLVFGPQTYHRLPGLLARADAEGTAVDTEFPAEPKFDFLPEQQSGEHTPVAFLAIQEGCDKFCSFCVVPYTRGAEQSRPPEAVLDEARRLVARALAEIPGLLRLRYTTSHPRDMTDELIAAHGEIPALMPFLHLPVQSGSDAVLARMNRRHRARDYLRIVERLRTARPDIALSSDFIVGHPGESERDFAATLALVREVGFAQAFSFKYSARPGTPAAAAEQVPEAEKKARLAALQALLREQQGSFNRAMVGRALPVLFTGHGRHEGQLVGRSPYLQPVHLAAPSAWIGSIRMVRILAAHPNSLAAALEPQEHAAA